MPDIESRPVTRQLFPPCSDSVSANGAESPSKVDGSAPLFPIQIPCPACGAQADEDCVAIIAGATFYVSYIHDSRRRAASERRAR